MPPTELKAPGRLGDPTMTLETDPRTNPALLPALRSLGMSTDLSGADQIPAADTSIPALEPTIATMSQLCDELYASFPNDLPSDRDEPAIPPQTLLIDGPDGHEIALHLYRPPGTAAEAEGDRPAVPAIVYFHGGGMTIARTLSKPHERWCTTLALRGVVAVLVDFRNAWTGDGDRVSGSGRGGGNDKRYVPFPAGLDDCVAATRFLHEHRAELGVSKIVLQGESGGANLGMAVALKGVREGWGKGAVVDGVSAQDAYISGGYGWAMGRKEAELPSLAECDGYMVSTPGLAALARFYAPDDAENPLAWPYFAKVEEMVGLPPHYISVGELDPLRSEALAYHRKLLAAGVQSSAIVRAGLVHGTCLFFRKALPAEHNREADDVVAFAKSL